MTHTCTPSSHYFCGALLFLFVDSQLAPDSQASSVFCFVLFLVWVQANSPTPAHPRDNSRSHTEKKKKNSFETDSHLESFLTFQFSAANQQNWAIQTAWLDHFHNRVAWPFSPTTENPHNLLGFRLWKSSLCGWFPQRKSMQIATLVQGSPWKWMLSS